MGLMKNKLDGRIISEFYKPERYGVQRVDGHVDKKTMDTTTK